MILTRNKKIQKPNRKRKNGQNLKNPKNKNLKRRNASRIQAARQTGVPMIQVLTMVHQETYHSPPAGMEIVKIYMIQILSNTIT